MRKFVNKLYCFSPPVMLATFVIEIILFAYTLWRYKMTVVTRLAAAMLFFLALFQLSEYNVCGRFGLTVGDWSRIGYIAITILPPLGLHLVHSLSDWRNRWLVWASYTVGIFWIVTFGFRASAFSGHVCAGNYAIFQLSDKLGGWYFTYYYALLFLGIGLALYFITQSKTAKLRQALVLQVAGYLSFLLPTAITNTLKPETINGIPSIMCGFAVLYAVALVFGVVPLTTKTRSRS